MPRKTHKRKKVTRQHGRKMGTHGTGARKNKRHSGHHGGKGMAGTGKRADHKKTLINKLYGHGYFGKQGITSKKTQKDKSKKINFNSIVNNLGSLIKQGKAKKTTKGYDINLEKDILLGNKQIIKIKEKLTIKIKNASKKVIEELKKEGHEVQLISNSIKNNKKEE